MIDSRAMLMQYMETALWASTDWDGNPLDATYLIGDFAGEAYDAMLADCQGFLETCEEQGVDLSTLSADQLGHDLWLTQNRHGAGFWDRGLGDLGDKLTEIAHSFGSVDVYVGDDGKLYVA